MEIFKEDTFGIIYKIILENTDVGIIITTEKGRIIDLNKKSLEILGFHEKKNLTEINIFQNEYLNSINLGDNLYKAFNECLITEKIQKYISPWKKEIYLKYTIYPVKINALKYAKIILKDYGKHKNNEIELEKLKKAIETAEEIIVITDKHGNIEYTNPAFTKITGYSYNESIGKNPSILKSGVQNKEFYKNLWSTLLKGNTWKGFFTNKKKDGTLYREMATITPIPDEKDNIINFIAVKRDITEETELQKQLLEAQKMESLGIISSGIAHEINTPLQYILDNINFVKENFEQLKKYRKFIHEQLNITDEIKEYQKKIDMDFVISEIPQALQESLEGIKIIKRIIDSMKIFSYHSKNMQIIDNINKYIKASMDISKNYWKNLAELKLELSDNLPKLKINVTEINRVLLNLIINSVDAIKEDKSKKNHYIKISTYTQNDYITIEVEDNGKGIPKEISDKIFSPFFTTKEVGKGTGQGLSISYDIIVRKHKGKFYFKSQEGIKTTFYIELPTLKIEEI